MRIIPIIMNLVYVDRDGFIINYVSKFNGLLVGRKLQ